MPKSALIQTRDISRFGTGLESSKLCRSARERVDQKSFAADVERFLEDRSELKLFAKTETLKSIIQTAFPK